MVLKLRSIAPAIVAVARYGDVGLRGCSKTEEESAPARSHAGRNPVRARLSRGGKRAGSGARVHLKDFRAEFVVAGEREGGGGGSVPTGCGEVGDDAGGAGRGKEVVDKGEEERRDRGRRGEEDRDGGGLCCCAHLNATVAHRFTCLTYGWWCAISAGSPLPLTPGNLEHPREPRVPFHRPTHRPRVGAFSGLDCEPRVWQLEDKRELFHQIAKK